MPDTSKFTDKAAELAGQAAAAAGPLAAQAKAFAGQAAAAAGPIAEQARVKAVQGVDVLAGNLDKLTGGKYSEQIHSVASKVEGALDTKPAAAPEPPVKSTEPPLRAQTPPVQTETPPLKPE